MDRADVMESTLLDAVDLAQESRHDRALAQALTLLILASDLRGDPERAHLWGRLADSALKRIGAPGEIAADRRFYLGIAANIELRPEQAIEHFQASLAMAARAGSRKSTHAAFNNIGIALTHLGRFDEAADHLRRALEVLEKNFGPDHPDVGIALYQLGKVERSRGDLESALRYYRRSLALYERLEWQGSYPGFPLTGLGETLVDLGRAAEALLLLERAVRLRSQDTRDPAQLALSRFQWARALDATGRSAAARRQALEAAALFGRLGDRARPDREEVEAWLAARGEG